MLISKQCKLKKTLLKMLIYSKVKQYFVKYVAYTVYTYWVYRVTVCTFMELLWLYRAIWHICYKNGSFSGNHCTDQNSIYGLSPCAKLISKSQLTGYHVQIPFKSNDWACVQQLLLPSAKLNSFKLMDMLADRKASKAFCDVPEGISANTIT